MTANAYITDIASFLPNAPVGNDEIENVLGMVRADVLPIYLGVDLADEKPIQDGCAASLASISLTL